MATTASITYLPNVNEKSAAPRLGALGLALAQTQIRINDQQNALNTRWDDIIHSVDALPGEPGTPDSRSSVHAALGRVKEFAYDELHPNGSKPDAGNYATLAGHLRDAIRHDKTAEARNLYVLAERSIQTCEDQSELIHLRDATRQQWTRFTKEAETTFPHLHAQDSPLRHAIRWVHEVGRSQLVYGDTADAPNNQTFTEVRNLLKIAYPQLTAAKLDPPEMQDPVWNLSNRSAMLLRMGQATERGLVAFPMTRREDMVYLAEAVYGQGYGAATLAHYEKAAMSARGERAHTLRSAALPTGLDVVIHVRNGKVWEYTLMVPRGKANETADFFRHTAMRTEDQITVQNREDNTRLKKQSRKRQKQGMEVER
jgi:hypothetical protein